MNLNNIMYIIIFLLLIVILVFMYFLSNNIKKNQNKINICDSDVMALRERVQSLTNKVNSMDEYLNKGMVEKKQGRPMHDESFTNILEKLSSMNGGLEDDEDESDDDNSDDEDDDSDDESGDEDESGDSDDVDSDDESGDDGEDESGDDGEDESGDESVEDILEEEETPIIIKEEEASVKEEEVPIVIREEENLGIDNIIQDEVIQPSKKYPDVDLSGLNVGSVMMGSDGKTKYVVSSNKAGKKSWKKSK
jgi:hypothetical protein